MICTTLNLDSKELSLFSLGYLTAIFDKCIVRSRYDITDEERHRALDTITHIADFLTHVGYDVNRDMDYVAEDMRIYKLDSLTNFMMAKLEAKDLSKLV